MKDINLYYRAFTEYRKLTINHKNCMHVRKYIKQANADLDKLVAVKFRCVIDEDWVSEIEKGLVYVEKAVQEERQFIRTEGEVVPIEKVRKVSKASVDHLARHSNLITHLPEDDNDIIPDQIFMVEKLSDYAVYENRFLYMLLRYLQDFITLRLEKIRNKVTTYNATLYIDKTIKLHNQNIKFKLDFSDQILNDIYLMEEYKRLPLIDRIEVCYHTVTALLQTPVMEEVSKKPLIKEPITKTNVLKMNPNFMAAVALYEYVASYKKDGFTITENITELSPFGDTVGDEYAELVNITSYLSYKYGNDFVDKLKMDYELEEREIAEAQRIEFEKKLEKIKKRIKDEGVGYEEYILTIENRNNLLNSQVVELYSLRDRVNELFTENKLLQKIIADKTEQIEFLTNKIDLLIESHKDEIKMLVEMYDDKIASLKNEYDNKVRNLVDDYENQLIELNTYYLEQIETLKKEYEERIENIIKDYEKRISDLISNYEEKIENLQKSYEEYINNLKEEHRIEIENIVNGYEEKIKNIVNEYEEKIVHLNNEHESLVNHLNSKYSILENDFMNYRNETALIISNYQNELNAANEKCNMLNEEKLVLNAKIHYMIGNNPDTANTVDFTSKDNIDQLEEEYRAFKSFFNRNWKQTKKNIRKEYLRFPKKNKDGEVNNDEEK